MLKEWINTCSHEFRRYFIKLSPLALFSISCGSFIAAECLELNLKVVHWLYIHSALFNARTGREYISLYIKFLQLSLNLLVLCYNMLKSCRLLEPITFVHLDSSCFYSLPCIFTTFMCTAWTFEVCIWMKFYRSQQQVIHQLNLR